MLLSSEILLIVGAFDVVEAGAVRATCSDVSPLIGLQVPPPLLTSQCLIWLDDSLADDESQTQQSRIMYTTSFSWLERDNSIRIWDPVTGRPQVLREANFQKIGHSIITLFAAFAGGLFARYLRSRDKEPRSKPH